MKIRTKLIVGALCSCLTVLLVGAIDYLSFQRVQEKNRQVVMADTITQSVFELNVFTNEYLLYREKRPKIQWEAEHHRLTGLLQKVEFADPEKQSLITTIRDTLEEMQRLFVDLTSTDSRQTVPHDERLTQQLHNRLQSQLLLKSRRMLSYVSQLKEQLEREHLSIQQRASWLTLIFVSGLAIVISSLGLFIARSINRPLTELIESTETVAGGNLDIHIATETHDEIGLLAQSFQRMVEQLQISLERYDLAVSGSSAGLWDWDITTNAIFYADRFKELLGFLPEDEFPPTLEVFQSHLHPDDAEATWAAIEHHLQERIPYDVEYRLRTKSGEYRWFMARGQALWNEAGNPLRMSGSIQDISDRKHAELNLKNALSEIEQLKDQLEAENIYLRREIEIKHHHKEIIGESQALKEVLSQVEQVAALDSTVLITGETGTGKGLIAQAIHQLSPRKQRPMITVNCAVLPSNLIENELFGREKGAYTGALTRQVGRFEIANGSTIFLDEIGELPPDLQTKLLRVLEEGEIERLGSTKTVKVDVRVIAATNRNLEQAMQEGRFREDLYFRLNVFPIAVPALRERLDDITLLIWAFVREFSGITGKRIESIAQKSLEELQRYSWPGNIRELRNVIERAVILSKSPKLRIDRSTLDTSKNSQLMTLEELERQHIIEVLGLTGGRISGEKGAAKILGINPKTLESRMKKLEIPRKNS